MPFYAQSIRVNVFTYTLCNEIRNLKLFEDPVHKRPSLINNVITKRTYIYMDLSQVHHKKSTDTSPLFSSAIVENICHELVRVNDKSNVNKMIS